MPYKDLKKRRECNRSWKNNNPEKVRESAKNYREENSERIKKYEKENRERLREYHRGYQQAWAKEHPEKIKEYSRKSYYNYIDKNRERVKVYHRAHPGQVRENARKRRSSIMGKLNHCVSSAIHKSLVGKKMGRRWESLVGYTVNQLKEEIESKFIGGMSWSNYGKKVDDWSIDHILPISWWEFDTPEDREFKQCWALCNLRPLRHTDNCSKGNRY